MKGGACKDVFVVSIQFIHRPLVSFLPFLSSPFPALPFRILFRLTDLKLNFSLSLSLSLIRMKAWEQCVDSCRDKDGGDFVESCIDQTKLLKDCMEENADYYGIMLQAEEESKAAANEVNEAKEATGEPLKEGGND